MRGTVLSIESLSPHSSGAGRQPVITTAALRQAVQYGDEEEDDVQPGGRLVLITDELDQARNGWVRTHVEFRAPFSIEVVESRFSHELYVGGFDQRGDVVIERWLLDLGEGSRLFTRPRATTLVGAPYAPPEPRPSVRGDVAFVSPSQRTTAPTLTRVELFRGPLPGGLRDLAVDPDGRFVLVLAETGEALYRLEVPSDGQQAPGPQVVLDAAAEPHLRAALALYPLEHETLGRTYVFDPDFSRAMDASVITLSDLDNDGVFDQRETLPLALHTQRHAAAVWLEDFYNY